MGKLSYCGSCMFWFIYPRIDSYLLETHLQKVLSCLKLSWTIWLQKDTSFENCGWWSRIKTSGKMLLTETIDETQQFTSHQRSPEEIKGKQTISILCLCFIGICVVIC